MEESFVMNVRRAIFEEVGPKVWGEVNLAQNLTHSPVYYRHEYGPKLGNRVDRQLTSLWLVSVEPTAERIRLKPDNEMAAFKCAPALPLHPRRVSPIGAAERALAGGSGSPPPPPPPSY